LCVTQIFKSMRFYIGKSGSSRANEQHWTRTASGFLIQA
jgi:hypothetical protein